MNDRTQLKHLSPDRIERNPDNPRLFFRTEEMETLSSSIRRYGIQVPLTVYEDGDKYFLIDGERRWRCARKLNMPRVPAIIQPKPSPLQNLLLMFNIHALREQWDYLTIANKLPSVIELHKAEHNGDEPTEAELSEITGLARGQIRRCRLLLDLPSHYRIMLEEELSKPKNLQTLSEDFFIEMERALKTVRSRIPAAIVDINAARDALIYKFKNKVIKNITDFRKLSKMATSVSNLNVSEKAVRDTIRTILNKNNSVSISDVFSQQFEVGYDQRKIGLNLDSVYNYLSEIEEDEENIGELPSDIMAKLVELADLIRRVMNRIQ